MKKLIKYSLPVWLPILMIVLVNEANEQPSLYHEESYCTRYCHNKECTHFGKENVPELLLVAYETNIRWLGNNPFGLSYQTMNILVYVIIAPAILLLLLWGLFRKRNGL